MTWWNDDMLKDRMMKQWHDDMMKWWIFKMMMIKWKHEKIEMKKLIERYNDKMIKMIKWHNDTMIKR